MFLFFFFQRVPCILYFLHYLLPVVMCHKYSSSKVMSCVMEANRLPFYVNNS